MSVYLSTQAAARKLGIAAQTLRKWRYQGSGPRSYKRGSRVFYEDADLDAWVRGTPLPETQPTAKTA